MQMIICHILLNQYLCEDSGKGQRHTNTSKDENEYLSDLHLMGYCLSLQDHNTCSLLLVISMGTSCLSWFIVDFVYKVRKYKYKYTTYLCLYY